MDDKITGELELQQSNLCKLLNDLMAKGTFPVYVENDDDFTNYEFFLNNELLVARFLTEGVKEPSEVRLLLRGLGVTLSSVFSQDVPLSFYRFLNTCPRLSSGPNGEYSKKYKLTLNNAIEELLNKSEP